QQSLKTRLAIFGETHPDVAQSYNNIGSVYDSQGDYVQALEMYQQSLKINLAIFGDTHPDVAGSYNNIGGVYSSQGNYVQALEMYQRSLKIRMAIFGETHPAVATIYSNIGVAYFAAIQKGVDVSGFKGLIETMAFTATTVGDDTQAAHAGMEGEYVVLEFADWTIESDSSLFDKNEELRGKPKTIVVMKGEAISQYHFENTIGVEFNFKKIGSQEKQRILKAYRDWKKNR
ncbi:MAG: tetratricopeptide repeat protein, partial [Bacteroidales bacterium]|nr:tetratricopeptide repeat protein [Bacteroidales bacterium]